MQMSWLGRRTAHPHTCEVQHHVLLCNCIPFIVVEDLITATLRFAFGCHPAAEDIHLCLACQTGCESNGCGLMRKT